MDKIIFVCSIVCAIQGLLGAEVRLVDLEPTDAQQYIEKQDQNLNYAPKIDTNVPAVRYLGNEPHHVLEDIYLARQYHGQDGLGGYLYGYNVPDIAKTERKKAGGDLRGAYNYIAGDGQEIKVEYWDDGNGFHQIDNVPKILPKQVDDAPDVKAAKEKFLARWHEEAERNSHPIANPYDNQQQANPLYQQQSQGQQYDMHSLYTQGRSQNNQNQIDYAGQYSENQNTYAQKQQVDHQEQANIQYQQQPQGQQSGANAVYTQGRPQNNQNQIDNSGQYSDNQNTYSQKQREEEEEESTGPPKGFFYSFDYPVGIIVQKEGVVKREGDLKDIYSSNKANFESQLVSGSHQPAASSQSGYLFVQK